MNNITLITGDAIEKLKEIKSSSIDLIIADPPYNLGKDYGPTNDNFNFEEYLSFSRSWISEATRILKDTGTIYIFMGFRFISYVYDICSRENKLEFCNWICWHYTQGIGKTKGFSPRHDDVLVFTKSSKYTFNLDDVRVPQKFYRARNNMRGANPGDVWEFSHVHYCNENRQNHPTQKPEGLIERMVLASSNKDETVLDPFAGSGTVLRVCQQLDRNAIGIEINPEYVQMINDRLEMPFNGFDSIDPRMERIPNDLNDEDIRNEYLSNHTKWFLSNHENAIAEFEKSVKEKYGDKKSKKNIGAAQIELFIPLDSDSPSVISKQM